VAEAEQLAQEATASALGELASQRVPHQFEVLTAGAGRPKLDCSVGVMAYNEEANIADAVASILGQRLTAGKIAELIVIASGCEDDTTSIVADIARRDPRVRLIQQDRREGKASAVNYFLREARSPLVAMVSADVLVKDGAFEAMLRHFGDPTVGMVGGHPIPVNPEATFLGHAVHLLWRLHDRISREFPKLGEMVAFRNVVPSIPVDTAADELSMQALIAQLGYRLVYEPDAIVYNRGPATRSDFVRQRRRIHAGHLRVREHQGYSAPTMSARRVMRALIGSNSFTAPRAAVWTIGTVGMEAVARALGRYDVLRRRPSHVWEISGSTKLGVTEGACAQEFHNVCVFHIVNFHHQELEIGKHASRQLARRVTDEIKRTLGPEATVTLQPNGTIVGMLGGDRDAAEQIAHDLARRLDASPVPVNGHGASTQVALAYAVITLPQSAPAGADRPRLHIPRQTPPCQGFGMEVTQQ
jgi:poly-beta-1,6-N-acetyl-D-glucosamine synthase